jgi:hypothetical protein
LPLLVGLKSEISISSELWFGASVNPLVTFIWSSGTSSVDFRGDLVGTVAEVVVSTCNATLHSSVHTKLFHFIAKLQSSTYITHYSHNNQKDLKLNLDRALRGHLIMIGYLLKITTEPIGNNEGLTDGKVYRVPR